MAINSGSATSASGWQEYSATAVAPDATNTGTWYGVSVKGGKRVGHTKTVTARSLDGSQPAASGALTKLRRTALAGLQPDSSGALKVRPIESYVDGSQPAPTGTLVAAEEQITRDLAGNQPVGGGGAAFSDDFNRADGSPGGNWSGSAEIVSNQLRMTAFSAQYLINSSSIGSADYTVQAVFTQGSLVSQAGVGLGLVARLTDTSNFYLAWLNEFGTDYILYNVSGGSYNEVGRWSTTALADPVTLALDCQGTTIRILVNDTQRVSVTNSTHTAEGDFGLRSFNAGSFTDHRIDDLEVMAAGAGAAGTLLSVKIVGRSLVGSQPASSSTLSRQLQASGTLVGAQPAPTGALTRRLQAARSSVGSQPSPAGALTQSKLTLKSLAGAQPSGSGALTRVVITARSLVGSQPASAAVITRRLQAMRPLVGSQPSATGTLTRRLSALRSLASPQPAPTATLAAQRLGAPERSLEGQQPTAAATLVRRYTGARALQGNAPGGQGELSRQASQHETLAGAQPYPTGTLSATKGAAKVLTGTQPYPTGALVSQKITTRTLAGSQPSASGTVTRRLATTRVMVGAQDPSTALLVRRISVHISLAGAQIFSTGTLLTQAASTRILNGYQISAYGDLIVMSAGRQITQEARILGRRSGLMALSTGRSTRFSLQPDPDGAVLATGRSAVLSRKQMDTVLEVEKV